MLNQVADGVWVRQSEWVWTNSIVVRGEDGLIVIDPGIHGSELNELADDLDRLGIPVVAGFSTHPHTDHLLWHSRFGDVPRYATAAGAEFAAETREQQLEGPEEDGWSDVPLELIALVTPLPADGGPVPGEIIEHQAHAVGHAAILLADRGVLLAGDMLSDVLIPLLDPRQSDQVGAYETALDRLGEAARHVDVAGPRPRRRCRGSRGGGPPRRRSRLHRRAAARRGTCRRASGCGLALRPPPVEPGAGPRAVGPDWASMPDDDEMRRPTASEELERWLESDGDKTLGSIIELFEEKSFALLFILLLGVSALPLPTGGATHVFEIVAMLLAVQLIAGRDKIWLPQRWRRLQLAGPTQQRFINRLMKTIRWLERFSRPRATYLFDHRLSNIVFGVLVLAGSLAAFLAVPFSGLDTLPSLGVVLLSIGVLLEDVAIVVLAVVVGVAGAALELFLGRAVVSGIGNLF